MATTNPGADNLATRYWDERGWETHTQKRGGVRDAARKQGGDFVSNEFLIGETVNLSAPNV